MALSETWRSVSSTSATSNRYFFGFVDGVEHLEVDHDDVLVARQHQAGVRARALAADVHLLLDDRRELHRLERPPVEVQAGHRDLLLRLPEAQFHAAFVRLHRVDRLEQPQDDEDGHDDDGDEGGTAAAARQHAAQALLAAPEDLVQVRRLAAPPRGGLRTLPPGALIAAAAPGTAAAVLTTPRHSHPHTSSCCALLASARHARTKNGSRAGESIWPGYRCANPAFQRTVGDPIGDLRRIGELHRPVRRYSTKRVAWRVALVGGNALLPHRPPHRRSIAGKRVSPSIAASMCVTYSRSARGSACA